MVGLFSKFSVSRSGHRRAQSTLDQREAALPISEGTGAITAASAALAAAHGIELAVEFKPLEHPMEPIDTDQPIQCPLPEPSILNDGRIWKERVSSGVQRKSDLEDKSTESGTVGAKPLGKRMILPSASAPEHNFLKMLEECHSSGM